MYSQDAVSGCQLSMKKLHHLHTSITLENIFLTADLEPDKWMHGWGCDYADSSIIYLTAVSAFSKAHEFLLHVPA
jgi:hypothetical protein